MSLDDPICSVLRGIGVTAVFGVPGIPITKWLQKKLQTEAQIPFYAMRNESSASYASGIAAYLGSSYEDVVIPGICITVNGPGMIHALPGLANAAVNGWPVLMFSSGTRSELLGKGAFQDAQLVAMASAIPCKRSIRLPSPSASSKCDWMKILAVVAREACTPPMGPCFIEIPGEFFDDLDRPIFTSLNSLPISIIENDENEKVENEMVENSIVSLIHSARAPLVIFGSFAVMQKHCATRARNIVQYLQVPFITTPMAKGIVPDSHGLCCNAARSMACREADVVLLIGAKFDWMIRPFLNHSCNIINCGPIAFNHCESHNIVNLVDPSCFGRLEGMLSRVSVKSTECTSLWLTQSHYNREKFRNSKLESSLVELKYDAPLNYYVVMASLRMLIDRFQSVNEIGWSNGYTLIAEGARTMDVTRLALDHDHPKCRIDAGSFGTMGIGLAAILVAHLHRSGSDAKNTFKPIIAILGDSALGFSLSELETLARYRVTPVLCLVINNSGVYSGVGAGDAAFETGDAISLAPTQLSRETAYEKAAEGLMSKSILHAEKITHLPHLLDSLSSSLADIGNKTSGKFHFLNVIIDPASKL